MGKVDARAMEEARRRYETTADSLDAIAAGAGMSRGTLQYYARKGGWIRFAGAGRGRGTRPSRRADGRFGREAGRADAAATPAAERARLVARLHRAFARQVADLEARFGGGETGAEQEARTLGTLARTLEKLIALARDGGGEESTEPVDLDQLRQGLAERVRRLSGGGGQD